MTDKRCATAWNGPFSAREPDPAPPPAPGETTRVTACGRAESPPTAVPRLQTYRWDCTEGISIGNISPTPLFPELSTAVFLLSMPLRLLSGVTLRYPWTQDIRGAPGKVCKSSTVRACAVFLRMPVGGTCQRWAGFRGNRLGHSPGASSLTACQLSAGEALGVSRLPATPRMPVARLPW